MLLALIVAVGAVAIARDWRPAIRVVAQPYFAVWGVLLALAFLSTIWSVTPFSTFEHAGSLTLLVAAVVVCVALRGGNQQVFLRTIAIGIVLVFVLSALLAIVDHQLVLQPAFNTAQGVGSVTRFQGITENPDELAGYGTIALPLLIWLASVSGRKERRWWVAALVLVVGESVLSASRIPLAIMALQALAFLFLVVRNRRLNVMAVGLLGVVALSAICLSVVSSHVRDRVFRLDDLTTFSGRTVAWKGGLHLLAQRALGGYGFGTEARVFSAYVTSHPAPFVRVLWKGAYVHNSYIGIGLQVGVLGIVCATLLLGWPLAILRRRLFAGANFAVASAILGAALLAFFESFFSSPGNLLTFEVWLLAALPFAVTRRS